LSDSANEAFVDFTDVIEVPTFRPDQGTQAFEVDIMSLLASETDAETLRIEDPFLYHSIFTPSGNLTKEAVNAAMAQIVTGSLTSRITVVRHRCIATECDAAMFYTPNPRMPVRNDENQLMFDEDNEDGDDNEDFDVAQLFLDSAPAMQ
jgi:hypothetical protein